MAIRAKNQLLCWPWGCLGLMPETHNLVLPAAKPQILSPLDLVSLDRKRQIGAVLLDPSAREDSHAQGCGCVYRGSGYSHCHCLGSDERRCPADRLRVASSRLDGTRRGLTPVGLAWARLGRLLCLQSGLLRVRLRSASSFLDTPACGVGVAISSSVLSVPEPLRARVEQKRLPGS